MCIVVQIIDLVVLYRISYIFLYEGVFEVYKFAHEVGGGGDDRVWHTTPTEVFLLTDSLSTPL